MFTKKLQIKRTTVSVPKPKSSAPPTPSSATSKPTHSKTPRAKSTSAQSERRYVQRLEVRDAAVSNASAKRKNNARPASATPDFGRDDESSADEDDFLLEGRAKRVKVDLLEVGLPKRRIRAVEAFEEADGEDTGQRKKLQMVHAAEIPRLDKATKYEPMWKGMEEGFEVELQYPSASGKERFALVKPTNDSQGYEAVHDIAETMHRVVENYVPEKERDKLDNETTGLPQRFSRAVNKKSEEQIRDVVREWNEEMVRLRKDGTIAKILDETDSVNPRLVERTINQTFSRTVSLNLKYLHQYKAGTDNVYGELLPKFVSQILRDLRVSSDKVFVDLGSGVGNVVLQVALEAGCESWGCEMMEKYCEVANLQQKEFTARCRLWGLSVGDTHLVKGDFLASDQIMEVLRRADVVLVNNQVFTPKTNDALTTLFLDLKEGAKIVSLKSFVPAGHKISARNSDSVLNLLRVEQKEYFSKCVSWTDQGGKYYISTKDSTAVSKFHAQNGF